MKMVTFVEPYYHRDRLGVLIDGKVVDLNLAYASYLSRNNETRAYNVATAELPFSMMDFLWTGELAWRASERAYKYANDALSQGKNLTGPRGERIVYQELEVKLRAPLPRPGKIVHTAGNFREHAEEGKKSGWEFEIPPWISFLKNPSAVIGQGDPIIYPKITKQLDHEIELAIVVGKKGKRIAASKAMDHVAGFTVFNDITARDIQREEMKQGLLNLGKNLDTFAPMGPCMVTKDQIGDPHKLKIELRVNGDVRQSSNTSRLAVTISQIIEHYSQLTLEPGDILTTGTVSGVAAFRTPDPTPYFLKPGDVIESEIENIGVLRNPVVAEE
jgi:2-keto-4-pentenoate hydratase/2-oxohepta-3-ene-1,7-dioic acid hydratase in catechol pathway